MCIVGHAILFAKQSIPAACLQRRLNKAILSRAPKSFERPLPEELMLLLQDLQQ